MVENTQADVTKLSFERGTRRAYESIVKRLEDGKVPLEEVCHHLDERGEALKAAVRGVAAAGGGRGWTKLPTDGQRSAERVPSRSTCNDAPAAGGRCPTGEDAISSRGNSWWAEGSVRRPERVPGPALGSRADARNFRRSGTVDPSSGLKTGRFRLLGPASTTLAGGLALARALV